MIDRACISINARCNLNCKYCHFGEKVNPFRPEEWEINEDEMIQVLDNIDHYMTSKSLKVFKLGIVGSGEPMLSFGTIEKAVRYVANHRMDGIKLYTITNGTILTDKQLDFFFEYKSYMSLNFSLDGYKELHEMARENFAGTYANILKYEIKFGEKPIINMVVTKHTLDHKNDVIDFLVHHQFNKVNFSIVFGSYIKGVSISSAAYKSFLHECNQAGITTRQLSKTRTIDCTKYGDLCGVGITNIYLTKQGVYPCARFQGLLQYRLGNLVDNFSMIESEMTSLKTVPEGLCYFEFYKVGQS